MELDLLHYFCTGCFVAEFFGVYNFCGDFLLCSAVYEHVAFCETTAADFLFFYVALFFVSCAICLNYYLFGEHLIECKNNNYKSRRKSFEVSIMIQFLQNGFQMSLKI